MLEQINEAVNAALATQAPTTPTSPSNDSPAEPLSPVAPTVVNAEQDELTRLRQENDRLRVEKTDHEAALAEQRLKVAAAQANRPSVKVGTGAQDAAVQQAIRAVGGNAKWHQLSPEQRAAALGVNGADTKLATIKRFFGPGSDAAAAQRLHSQQPGEYKRLRALAKVNGIL